MKTSVRWGAVQYLNAKPLCWTLRDACLEHPPRLLKRLEGGEIDVALLSSVEYLRRPDRFGFVPGLGVCSDGPVESVRLYAKKPLANVRSVALDPHSLTANAMVRVILSHAAGSGIRFTPRRGTDWSEFDAAVVIGDAAFGFDEGRYLDLGAEWKRLTGLPFVYALWIYDRARIDPAVVEPDLRRAFADGWKRLDEIAEAESARLNLDKAFCLRYLKQCVHYRVGPREEEGLSRFGTFLKELKVL